MPEKLSQKKITADPSKFSFIEEALDLELKGKEIKPLIGVEGNNRHIEVYVDKTTGERFIKTNPYNPEFQKLCVLLLKGVINVSDVVKVGDDHFSHEQNFNNLGYSQEDVKAEMEADMFILRNVFGDPDHAYYSADDPLRTKREKENSSSIMEHHNLVIDEKNQKLGFFDFSKAFTYSNNFEDLGELWKEDPNRNLILKIIKKKVATLSDLFRDSELKRLEKIIQKSEAPLSKEVSKKLLNRIKSRLQVLNEALYGLK